MTRETAELGDATDNEARLAVDYRERAGREGVSGEYPAWQCRYRRGRVPAAIV